MKLRAATDEAAKKQAERHTLAAIRQREAEENTFKANAAKLCDEFVTETNLISLAHKGVSNYPLLFISDRHPVKNKKTSYRYNIGKEGQYLFEELERNGFEPVIIIITHDSQIDGYNTHKESPVKKVGYYLGVEW